MQYSTAAYGVLASSFSVVSCLNDLYVSGFEMKHVVLLTTVDAKSSPSDASPEKTPEDDFGSTACHAADDLIRRFLTMAGAPERDMRRFALYLKNGHTLIAVMCSNGCEASEARAVLAANDAEIVSSSVEAKPFLAVINF